MIVLVEDAVTVGRDKNIRPTIVVVIAHGHAHPKCSPAHPRLFGNIRKRAVAIILIQRVADRPGRLIEVRRTAVDQINIHPSIVIEIQKGASRPQRLGKIALGRHRVIMHPCNAAGRRGNFFEQRTRWSAGLHKAASTRLPRPAEDLTARHCSFSFSPDIFHCFWRF